MMDSLGCRWLVQGSEKIDWEFIGLMEEQVSDDPEIVDVRRLVRMWNWQMKNSRDTNRIRELLKVYYGLDQLLDYESEFKEKMQEQRSVDKALDALVLD